MRKLQFLFTGLLCLYSNLLQKSLGYPDQKPQKVHYLDANSEINYKPVSRGIFDSDLRIYCFRGNAKTLARYFETIELRLEIEGDEFTQYDGITPEEVQDHHSERRSLFSFNLFTLKKTRLQLPPFEQRCVGIETFQPYQVRLHQVRIDFWRVIQLIVGLMLFLSAEKLGHNPMFYYITGVALGICCSFMLLIWLVGKMVPRRPMMYGFLVAGWTIGIYVIQLMWENLQMILFTYRTYVFWYILTTGVLSFFFCYRLGPPKNKRSRNIIKWTLQLGSLLIVYLSSHFEEASVAFIILTITYYYLPRTFLYKLRSLYLRRFPPKRRLLTNEEYYEEGVRETTKALEDLRAYARSPDCKQWKVMCKLNDPLRFAGFVEGKSHLRDEEILEFECSNNEANNYDDDSEEVNTDRDEEEEVEDNSVQSSGNRYTIGRRINRNHEPYEPVTRRRNSGMVSPQAQSPDELSDDNDDDADKDGDVNKGTRKSYTPNSYSYNSRQSVLLNGQKMRRRSTSSSLSQCNDTAQRIRAARIVSNAQRSDRGSDRQSRIRSFEMQHNSGESD